jgi:hypothetical protein
VLPANLDSQGLRIWYSSKAQEGLAGSSISYSAMRPVVIVLLDPTGDRCSHFLHTAILRRPDFFLQAAMESLDVAVAFGVMIGRPPVRDAEPPQRF